jgi:hypothetical protein
MSRLRFRISLSLDGFVAGPGQSVDNPIGIGGMRLHQWVFPLRAARMKRDSVRYMLLVYTNESQMEQATDEMLNRVAEGHRVVMEEARRAGSFVAAEPLATRPPQRRSASPTDAGPS